MCGVDHRNRHIALFQGAALVKANDRNAFGGFQMGHQIVNADHRNVQVFGDGQRVACVIPMPMRYQNRGGPFDGAFAAVLGKHRVSGHPRVQQQNLIRDFDSKA